MFAAPPRPPASLAAIEQETHAIGFTFASDSWTGALLRTLAASKPACAVLELGTGTGCSAAWLLDGMDGDSTLLSVDSDGAVSAVARRHLGGDPRATFVVADGGTHLAALAEEGCTFDIVFADAWAGSTHISTRRCGS